VQSLADSRTLYARNGQKLLMPASSMKTVTLAVAAERLGWDFSFETRLVADGSIDERFLNGDLIVAGQGDPSLDDWDGAATRLFATWAQAIKAKGIDTIGGRIIGNDNAFDDTFLGSGWAWDDLDRSFATSVGALQFNQNTAQVTIGPGAAEAAPAAVTLAPGGSGLVLRNLITTGPASVPATVQTRRLAGSAVLELRGSVPLGSASFTRNASVYNPTLYFVNALREALIANGIDVRGLAMDIDDVVGAPTGDEGMTLVSHRSPSLSVLAATMMKLSQNLYAETLMQALGGPQQARSVLEDWGIAPQNVLVADGSGLSRYNLVTPEVLVAILTRVAKDDRLQGPFAAALPIGGRDGTLEQRMRGTAAEGNVRAKTGSFSNARSLSGYVRTADGEPLTFAIVANNFGIPPIAIEQTIDSIVIRLAEFRR
jgi:serine-type D-Ala-D-Ala carboxypeptidase/endopeptidase (penicillin-binding protein 4)